MTKLRKSEFLEWGYGNLLDNANRGVVAEFIVAKALNIASGQRREWDYADMKFRNVDIEVKSSAYLQAWPQNKPSVIQFDIAPRSNLWDAETSLIERLEQPKRLASIYVFCVFTEREVSKANPLDTEQWRFLVIATRVLDEKLGSQKSARLSTLKIIAKTTIFQGVRDEVVELIDQECL